MVAITDVTLVSGAPTAGDGTVSTLDKFNGTAGASTTRALTVQGIASGTAMPVSAASLPLPTGAATSAKQPALGTAGTASADIISVQGIASMTPLLVTATLNAETTKVLGVARMADGSGNLLTSTGNALDINIKSGANANGRAVPGSSAPVVLNSMTYKAVAASASATLLGATGASGDYLDGILIIPATAAAGVVSITDGGGSAITIFAGGGTTALPTLAPFYVPIGAISSGGAGGWKVTTGTNVSVIGVGNFT